MTGTGAHLQQSSREWHVAGRVQGVGFRAATSRQAHRFGLRCDAVNLPDGRVRVRASGAIDDLDSLEHWLAEGPPMARVDSVSVTG